MSDNSYCVNRLSAEVSSALVLLLSECSVEMLHFWYILQKRYFTLNQLRLQLHGAIYRPDSFVLMLRYCANLKAVRYESTSLNRIVTDKSHRVSVA